MKPYTPLVRVVHGSQLYGTSTPTSDQDFKGVHLPSGRGIILGQREEHRKLGVVSKIEGTDKNAADAIDDESFSVQRFFDMLMKGDTVATEILFAPVEAYGVLKHHLWWDVQQVGKQLLNRQCKGFVGYCVRQAAKYGIKGSRMNAVKFAIDHLTGFAAREGGTTKLSWIEGELRALFEGQEHVKWENIPHPDGRDCWHLDVCDRKMPMTATIGAALSVYEKVWENYGQRARAAMTNEGIDWKAVSHAVRVAGQAIELLDTGTITFPRPNADQLLKIKQGELSYAMVSEMLEVLVAEVQEASERSHLPEVSDRSIADALVERLYLEQVR